MKPAWLILLIGLSSCAMPGHSPANGETQLLSAADVVASSASNTERAEKLAKIADTLFSAGAPQQAMDVSTVALELDPANVRAGLILSVAKPLTLLRGFMERFTNYTQTWPHPDLSEFTSQIQDMRYQRATERDTPRFDDFLWDSAISKEHPAFTTEKSLQDELDQIIVSFDELRRFTKANRESKIAISATSTMLPVLIDRYASACHVVEDSKLTYRLDCPPDHDTTLVMFDRADFEMLTDVASYYEFALTFANAYDLTGLAEAYDPSLAQPRAAMIQRLVGPSSQFGKLRATAKIKDMKDLTIDIVNGMNWAISNQKVICFHEDVGRMNHIFDSGLCLGGGMSSIMDPLSAISAGKTIQVQTPSGKSTDMNAMVFMETPIKDLQTLAPLKLTPDGVVIGIADQTLGGVFPKNDFNSVLALTPDSK